MTKSELVAQIAEKSSITKKAADAALKTMIETVEQTLKKDGKIRIDGFGTFKVADRKARTGVNPRTKEKMNIPATQAAVFRPAKALKDAIKKQEAKPAGKAAAKAKPAEKKVEKKAAKKK
jgi:DNA-binding protein HU-beta